MKDLSRLLTPMPARPRMECVHPVASPHRRKSSTIQISPLATTGNPNRTRTFPIVAQGPAIVPAIRDRLRTEESAEVQVRLKVVLDRYNGPSISGDEFRRVRAVELLEHLGTPDARKVLAALAAGGPSRQTADAAAAIRRLGRRPGR